MLSLFGTPQRFPQVVLGAAPDDTESSVYEPAHMLRR